MKSKEEIKKWILENCTVGNVIVGLKDINFGDKAIDLSGIIADDINNAYQKAQFINNNYQIAVQIENGSQDAGDCIYNGNQIATDIINELQDAVSICNKGQIACKIKT